MACTHAQGRQRRVGQLLSAKEDVLGTQQPELEDAPPPGSSGNNAVGLKLEFLDCRSCQTKSHMGKGFFVLVQYCISSA